jgi:VanZ family protein
MNSNANTTARANVNSKNMKRISPFVIPFLSVSFFGFILWIIYLANTGQSSVFFELVSRIPYGDKLGHFCLFGLLTLAANFTLKLRTFKILSIKLYLGSLLVLAFVVLEESSQFFIATRTVDIFDLSADFIGIVFFNVVTRWLQKHI